MTLIARLTGMTPMVGEVLLTTKIWRAFRPGGIGREGAQRDRNGCVEAVFLNDHSRMGFSRIASAKRLVMVC